MGKINHKLSKRSTYFYLFLRAAKAVKEREKIRVTPLYELYHIKVLSLSSSSESYLELWFLACPILVLTLVR